MPLVRVSNGGSPAIRFDFTLDNYYGVQSKFNFTNVWGSVTFACAGNNYTTYHQIHLYGDGVKIATAYGNQGSVTVDISSYTTIGFGARDNEGNNYKGWAELS